MRNISFLRNPLIAHRGLYNKNIPENSLLAFEKAIKHRMTIEFDVQLTKDQVVVVYHDRTLKRLMNINKTIGHLTYEELNSLVNWHVPTLSEVLQLVNGKVSLLIELKNYSKNHTLESKVSELLDNYQGKFAIQSFSPKTIYWFKKNRNHFIRGQLLTINYKYNKANNFIYKHMLFNLITHPDFISYNIKGLPNKRIAKARKRYLIIGWTITNKEQLIQYQNDCDNFIVENVI